MTVSAILFRRRALAGTFFYEFLCTVVQEIPPTAVGGLFKSFLQTEPKNQILIPSTAVDGLFKS